MAHYFISIQDDPELYRDEEGSELATFAEARYISGARGISAKSDKDDMTLGPSLAVVTALLAPMQSVQPVMNDNDLIPDVGRITHGWPSGASRGCSAALTSADNVRRSSTA